MPEDKAKLSKEKGNEAFKNEDYPTAIGFYTSAMMEDPTEPTYALNRAAAYLKLGKYQDAERDCTTALKMVPKKITPQNAKAFFRRAQARIELGNLKDAAQDLSDAYDCKPSDESITKLLGQVQEERERLREESIAKSAELHLKKFVDPTGPPKRRRVPIEIVEDSNTTESTSATTKTASPTASAPAEQASSSSTTPAPVPKAVSELQPSEKPTQSAQPSVSQPSKPQPPPTQPSKPSEFVKPEPSKLSPPPSESPQPPQTAQQAQPQPDQQPHPQQIPQPQQQSFKEAKQTRETARPSRVGGGIFRGASGGGNTVFTMRETGAKGDDTSEAKGENEKGEAKDEQKEGASAKKTRPKRPETLFDLVRAWNAVKSWEERWDILSTIPTYSLPTLCKTSLEPSFLASLLETLDEVVTRCDLETQIVVRNYMESLVLVSRFDMVYLFLSSGEKEKAKSVWKKLGVSEEELKELERWGRLLVK